jgi:hypothetical protein
VGGHREGAAVPSRSRTTTLVRDHRQFRQASTGKAFARWWSQLKAPTSADQGPNLGGEP